MQYTQTELPVDGLLTNKIKEFSFFIKKFPRVHTHNAKRRKKERENDWKVEQWIGKVKSYLSWVAHHPKLNLIGRCWNGDDDDDAANANCYCFIVSFLEWCAQRIKKLVSF